MKKIITVVIALTAACAAATIASAQTVATPAEATTLAAAADTVKTAVADTVKAIVPVATEAIANEAVAAEAAEAAPEAAEAAPEVSKEAVAEKPVAKEAQAEKPVESKTYQAKGEKAPAKEASKTTKEKASEKAVEQEPATKEAEQEPVKKAEAQPEAEKGTTQEAAPAVPEMKPIPVDSLAEVLNMPADTVAELLAMPADSLIARSEAVAAQIEELEEMECESEFEKYTSLAVGLGAQFYMGENNKYWDVPDPKFYLVTTKVLDLSVTRQHGPVFSWGADLNAAEYIGLYQKTHPNARFTTDEFICKNPGAGKYYYRQSGWYARADLFAGFNVINIFRGYKEKPVFDLDAKIGAGAIFGVGSEDDKTSFAPQITAGLEAKFNITQRIAIKAAIRGALVGDKFDGESRADEPDEVHKKANIPMDGIFGATVGVSFRLGKNSTIKKAKVAEEERLETLEQLRIYQQNLEEIEAYQQTIETAE